MSQAAPAQPAPSKRRGIAITVLLLIFSAVGIAGFLWWYLIAQFQVTTDNAYVAGNIVQITPQTAGTVTDVKANNTDRVTQGQVLVQLDGSDAQVALQSAEAALAAAVRNVRSLYANTRQSDAGVTQMQAEAQNARAEYERLANLHAQKFISVEALNTARTTMQAADAALQKAQAQREGAAGMTEHTSIAGHPQVSSAAAQVKQAYLALARTQIVTPVTGDVVQRAVQVGARVAPGTALMAVIPPEQMWVDANFKETQLDTVRIGQPVTLSADLYGSGTEYHGTVAGFAAGTGSAFALLPAQNASGNWIKIVQRVPVRIELDAADLRAHPLRIGLSVRVKVDTHDRSGAVAVQGSGKDKATLSHTDVFAQQAQAAEAQIAKIIATNSGQNTP